MDQQKIENIRHSLSHIMTMAVLELYPNAGLGVGPVIENGFYQDYDLPEKISEDVLSKLEQRMKELIKEGIAFEQYSMDVEKALDFYKDDEYKTALITDLQKEGETEVSFYKSGNFENLCKGPHVATTKEIDRRAFALTKIAGAYWRGDEKNKMLTRIYGVAFENKEALKNYLAMVEEAKKRDHRKLGKELDLFTFSDLVGPGLPLFTPKGTIIRNQLQQALLDAGKEYGMQPVSIPHIAKRALYETSGHADKFGDELIRVVSHYDEFVMKPVNCPHHTQIYASRPRSYRDLPLRYMESTIQYRDEKPGEIGGLTRVRAITCDDGHTFCTVEQIKEEVVNLCKIIETFYTGLGLYGKHWVSLSVRDSKNPDGYIGKTEDWDMAESMLEEMAKELVLDAKRVEGEAAIYGPKIDFMFEDSLGREWQLATVQLDFNMPKRFGLVYTDKDGKEATPVMIHRAILGSYERFMAVLIEHFAGAFPLWLSPVQVHIVPVSTEKHLAGAKDLAKELRDAGVRTEVDEADETVGKKIRKAATQKAPYILVVGEKELAGEDLCIRKRGTEEQETLSKNVFIEKIQKEIREKVTW
ncbi:MAG: threonine--tRNA ligase [Candidatus Magasanikbacteria bacterium]|nr:threonine--tRNA ligase [Candidatus Magasanikbacteria bacterium]